MNSYTGSQEVTSRKSEPMTSRNDLQPGQDLIEYAKVYAQRKPEVAALWCFGLGFILGWKLKPW